MRRVLTGRTLAALFIICIVSASVGLVYFAINADELPESSIRAVIRRQASELESDDNALSVFIHPEEVPVVSFDLLGFSTSGAGSSEYDRSEDIGYTVRAGETLSEIARSFGLQWTVLGYYNRIPNVNRIQAGVSLQIPSYENEQKAATELAAMPAQRAPTRQTSALSVRITYESQYNLGSYTRGLEAKFRIVAPQPDNLTTYEWEFGDGSRSSQASPIYNFVRPRTYSVRLTARDRNGNIYKSNPLFIDIPHPDSVPADNNTTYLTFSSMEEYFVTSGRITKVLRYSDVESAPLDFLESDPYFTKVRFTAPGFHGLEVEHVDGEIERFSIFVSPVPSKHVDAPEEKLNWYRTQFNTGTTSNCGPASVSMAIGWAGGQYFPVATVRQQVGWTGNGGTNVEQLLQIIRDQGVRQATMRPLRSAQDIREVIDSGAIAIILFHTGGLSITQNSSSENLFDRYYNDAVGHYIVIKGYSLDGRYFVTYDPVPSDWSTNSFRYGDELSMIGRNRYYDIDSIMGSLRRNDMIVVPRAP
ncbi:MAG: hypothetical protein A2087_14475 [Spirochaetes bacterium GWD1_61_31]|nr:MAG: hypothetical protein A2Y37_11065 [Spirochaetes bacterium GWB1_60_80]OHD37294.1 MAG: hypothetical protein A2087_14475 [Spirochaetes bacterium GWD1_61_31]OHD44975.1 MAG: hypothetical protein A2Y35_13110 [Spirochaetes bacterium GWE1_60_18]